MRRLFGEVLESRRLLAALRMVAWNVEDGPATTDLTTIFQAIGNEQRSGIQQRANIIALQETNFTSINNIESVLETLHGVNYETVSTPDGFGDSTGFVYDTTAVTLEESVVVCATCTHPSVRAKFQPNGAPDDREFYAYTMHLKAGSSGSDLARRDNETTQIRNNADLLPEGTNILYMGDFNTRSSSEAGFQNLIQQNPPASSNAGQAQDPINRLGTWHNNFSFLDVHTQNPRNDPQGGFMDDRFDFQLASDEFFDSVGIDYIAGTYRAFGNNGTHNLNGPITSGSGASTAVLQALARASDHLPVVASYDIGTLTPGISIVESGGDTTVSEGGGPDSYLVALATQPTQNVTVTVTPQDNQIDLGGGAGNPISLLFTPTNFSPQTVTVTPVNDSVVEPTVTSSITHVSSSLDNDYDGLTIPDVDVTVLDDDASIVISEIMYNPVTEITGTELEYIEIVNTGSGAVSLDGWRFDDEDATDWDPIPSGTVLAPNQVGVFFNGSITDEVTFRSAWNVPASALVVGLGWGDLDNSPSGGNETLELLDSSSAVKFNVQFDDVNPWPTDVPDGPSIYLRDLSFNPNFGQNWRRSQVGSDDGRSAAAPYSSSDIGSPGQAPGISGPLVSLSVDDVAVNENAGILTFTISASTAPDSSVSVNYSTSSISAVAGLDFVATSGVATIPAQSSSTTVDVSINEDMIAEIDEAFQLEISSPSAGAVIVDGIGFGTILDNDNAGVLLTETGGSTEVVEGGATDSFDLALDSIPTSDVTITITPDSELDLGAGAGISVQRIFTPTNATTAQTIIVEAFDDFDSEGSHTGLISFAVTSSDPFYDATPLSDLTAAIVDNEAFVGLELVGEVEPFVGPGTYSFEYSVSSVGGSFTVNEFQIPFAFDHPGVSFSGQLSDFVVNPAFDLAGAVPLNDTADYGLLGFSLGQGLALAAGDTVTLFTINLDVSSAAAFANVLTEVGTPVSSGPTPAFFRDPQADEIENVDYGPGLQISNDTVPPMITDVIASGSTWGSTFIGNLASDPLGLSLPGADQLRNLPWNNVDTFYVEFSEDVGSISASDVALTGVSFGTYTLSSVTYDPLTFTAEIVVAAPIAADNLTLTIADSVTDLSGNALDGEWVDTVSLVSGDTVAGGNADIGIDILPGDFDNSSDVGVGDLSAIAGLLFTSDPFADVDATGDVGVSDLSVTAGLLFTGINTKSSGGGGVQGSLNSSNSHAAIDKSADEDKYGQFDQFFHELGCLDDQAFQMA